MTSSYYRNLNVLARGQARFDAMEPPEYYEDGYEDEEPSNEDDEESTT